MTPFRSALTVASAACAVLLLPAAASAATLELTPGKVRTDPAGAYVTVAVKNNGADVVAQTQVTCAFFAGKRALGKSSTVLFAIVPGVTGTDQVRMLGASSATRADCAIDGQK
ncbi:hypothetical protein V5F49_06620 [Xanthobacter sp. V3C-3]|uniref:hypothetical protein n=1 Tax=Xanthobacter lutulentifluminis TaxID=3119935 RepID=UPI0037267F65